jgi:putative PIN family toxin of toxin-antitoxin system
MSIADGRLPVVFDCMVFLQGAARVAGPSAACLKLVEDNRVELFLSARILSEVQDVLTRPKLQRKFPILTPEYVDTLLQALIRKATIFLDVPQQFAYERDPKDEPYINLALASGSTYLVSRDKDLLDLMSNQQFRTRFPELTILDPVAFLQISRENQVTLDAISSWLRMIYNLEEGSRIDVTVISEGKFQAVLVNADDSVDKTIEGSFKRSGGRFMLAPLEQPDLSLEQLKVYDAIIRDFTDKLRVGEENDLSRIQLVQEGDYPELFNELGDRQNIAGSVKAEMLSVWHSLDHMLRMRGYRAIKRLPQEGRPAALLAEKHTGSFPF